MSQRAEVFRLDEGRCVGCDAPQRASGSSWDWQAHHVVKAQTLKRNGVSPARLRDATFCVLLCRACHMAHENPGVRNARVPLERLPRRVVEAVDALGTWAEDLLRRYHPPTDAGRIPAQQEVRPHGR